MGDVQSRSDDQRGLQAHHCEAEPGLHPHCVGQGWTGRFSVCLVYTMKITRFGSFPGYASPLLGHHAAALPAPQPPSAPGGNGGAHAMPPAGTNEQAIIDVLTKRSNAQRQQIAKSFKAQFGKVRVAGVRRWAVETAAARDNRGGSSMLEELQLIQLIRSPAHWRHQHLGHMLKIWCILSLKIRFNSSSCVLPRKLTYRWLPTHVSQPLSHLLPYICSRVPSLSYFPASTLCLSNFLSLEGPFLSHMSGMQDRLSPVPCDGVVSSHWSCHSRTVSSCRGGNPRAGSTQSGFVPPPAAPRTEPDTGVPAKESNKCMQSRGSWKPPSAHINNVDI